MPRGDPPLSLEVLAPYYSGAYLATVALKGRLARAQPGPEGRAAMQELNHYQRMVSEFRDAINKTIELKRHR